MISFENKLIWGELSVIRRVSADSVAGVTGDTWQDRRSEF